MEHYCRGELIEEPLELAHLPFKILPDDVIWMKVKPGSRVANMVGYVKAKLDTHEHVLWSGSGLAITKTIQSAEILKKAVKDLHQETYCCYRRSVEVWKPKENDALDTLRVNRDVPSIHILLSKSPLNASSPCYQPPGASAAYAPFWSAPSEVTTTQTKKPTLLTPTGLSAGDQSLKKKRRRKGEPPSRPAASGGEPPVKPQQDAAGGEPPAKPRHDSAGGDPPRRPAAAGREPSAKPRQDAAGGEPPALPRHDSAGGDPSRRPAGVEPPAKPRHNSAGEPPALPRHDSAGGEPGGGD